MNPKTLNPNQYPDWNQRIATLPGATFFHSSEWAHILTQTYGYTPHYITTGQNGRITALLPVMGINSILTGRRGVSLPFTDQCDPLADRPESFDRLWQQAKNIGTKSGWKHIELRGDHPELAKSAPSAVHHTHILDLTPSIQELRANLRSSTRRNIKKAEKTGVTVDLSYEPDALRTFVRLNRITRKRHGLPPQPFGFFRNLYNHAIAGQKGFILLAGHEGKTIAGAIFIAFNDTVIFKYGASDKRFQNLRANNLIMWQAIQWARQNKYRYFHFGRTEPENPGLLQFKRGWGAVEKPLHYYRYDIAQNRFTTPKPKIKTTYTLFKKMPYPILTLTGRLLYRHIG